MESIGLGSGANCSQWCWTKGDPHTKSLICRGEGKRISLHVQARTKQENVVLFYDMGIFQLPLQENRSRKILLCL